MVFGNLSESKPSRIIKDSRWLQPLSPPPGGKPLQRERELKAMALSLKEVFRTGSARNLFVSGEPGTGKTICIKYILAEVRQLSEKHGFQVASVYVNAGRTRTPYFTMLQIVQLLGLDVPDQGYQMYRLKKKFEDTLRTKSVVIGLDEVDALLLKQREPLVYYLNRQPNTTLVLTSNTIYDAASLPSRALSTLQLKLLHLKPYTLEQAKIILTERAARAFQPNTLPDKFLTQAAEIVAQVGDIRAGFRILLTAGLLAEDQGKLRVDNENLESAMKDGETPKQLQRLHQLKKKHNKLH